MTEGFGADCQQPVGQHDAFDQRFGGRTDGEILNRGHGIPVQLGGDDHFLGGAEIGRDGDLAAFGVNQVGVFVILARITRLLRRTVHILLRRRAAGQRCGAKQKA